MKKRLFLQPIQKLLPLLCLGSLLSSCSTQQAPSTDKPDRSTSSVDPNFGRSQFKIGREDCVTIKAIPNTAAKEDTLKDEDKLCTWKFEDPQIANCPGLGSTNPSVEVQAVPEGMTREAYTNAQCKLSDRLGKKLLKFKQSTSCSHTSSILGYGKLSDALGVHVEIPASVYRTMEIKTH
jgi:hypothetical protein